MITIKSTITQSEFRKYWFTKFFKGKQTILMALCLVGISTISIMGYMPDLFIYMSVHLLCFLVVMQLLFHPGEVLLELLPRLVDLLLPLRHGAPRGPRLCLWGVLPRLRLRGRDVYTYIPFENRPHRSPSGNHFPAACRLPPAACRRPELHLPSRLTHFERTRQVSKAPRRKPHVSMPNLLAKSLPTEIR